MSTQNVTDALAVLLTLAVLPMHCRLAGTAGAVATHPRNRTPGRYSTQTAHMPPNHQHTLEWTPERLLQWAGNVGPQTQQFLQALLTSRQHPEQAFRSCLGILHLSYQYERDQMEMACQQAHQAKTLNYQGVKGFLEHLPPAEPGSTRLHENIRGPFYYQ